MSLLLLDSPNNESVYYQWEWQESDTIWRRYPCTISHKLNAIINGQTIYVTIYEWVYVITKQNEMKGTQTNLFTQATRKIRVINHKKNDSNMDDIKENESKTDNTEISLYYNYGHANVVLISSLESNELKVKDLFYRSVSNTEYEITLMTQVQLSRNNSQYQNYRKHLKQYCKQYNKRKDEIENLFWSNCNSKNKQYAHSEYAINLIQSKNKKKNKKQKLKQNNHMSEISTQSEQNFIYFCRAIYLKIDDEHTYTSENKLESADMDTINSCDVIDQIPLYLITFRKIQTFDNDEMNGNVEHDIIANSLFTVNGINTDESFQHSLEPFHSYSQPLLDIQNNNSNGHSYGTMNGHKKQPSWHDIMSEQKKKTFSSTFDINLLIDKLLSVREAIPGTMVNISIVDIENICLYARTLFMQQPVLLELETPINIVGDIHGQYYDLLRLFEYGSYPPYANYLFLGDYVDRGGQSLESICLLLCYKIKYEENFFLLRGNHESENINRIYGFYDECKRRYSVRIWKKFVDVFNHLPIAATICQKIFCVHGGLSPQLFLTKDNNYSPDEYGQLSFDDNIKKIQRPTDIGDCGLVCDLLWSDPSFDINGFYDNGDRGVSYYFGKDIVDCFNKNFNIDLICRAHQVVEDGYEFFNKRSLVTIFSAPNYCGEFDNCAAFMKVDAQLKCSFVTMDPQRKYKPMLIKRKN